MDAESFVADLASLVSFETTKGNDKAFDQALHFIHDKVDRGAKASLLGKGDGRVLLIGNTASRNPDVCYLAHVDVVPGQKHQFALTKKGDIVSGRGVSDMKFSIPIGYNLLNFIISAKLDLSFVLAITCDEESGGFLGAKYLEEKYKLCPKLLIVPDGGDNFVLVHKSKGVCQLKIISKGKPAHASRPWLGKNALVPLTRLSTMLLDKYEQNNNNPGWHTTMNLGKILGGDNPNRVAATAEMYLDFRFPSPEDSVEKILDYVSSCAKSIDADLVVELYAQGESTYVKPSHPLIKLFRERYELLTKQKLVIDGGYGSTDARHFNKHGIPFVMTKPLGGDIHGDNEYINVSSCQQYYEIFADYLVQLASKITENKQLEKY